MGANKDHLNLIKTGFGVLLLALLQTRTEAQLCTAPLTVNFNENNTVGAVVATIDVTGDVTIELVSSDTGPFIIQGNNLVATEVLDFEDANKTTFGISIRCTAPGSSSEPYTIYVSLRNINDNPPTFEKDLYTLEVEELLPVDTPVGIYPATDKDNMGQLFYTLTSDAFKLRSRTDPTILVAKPLDYDKVKTFQLILTVQDTDPPTPSHIASTTIDITITDVDNRPPWFQPCDTLEIQGVTICPNQGYTGSVNLGEQTTGPLTLKPEAIRAIDGDNGINVAMTYSIISGNDGTFEISPETGAITMLKATAVTDPIHMTIMASQTINSYQFATTSLVIQVAITSLHKPQFERAQYDAVVEGVGRMAMEATDKNKAVKIIATDEDYASVGGINPNIVYTTEGNTSFSVISGFLFMTTEVPGGVYTLQVKAEDTTNFDTATAQIAVEVVPGSVIPPPGGGFSSGEMAAVGASLGILLFVCIVVIVVLAVKIRKGNEDWKKINEASVFRSSLGPSGQKEGVQFTNEAFQNDDDDNDDKSGPSGGLQNGTVQTSLENDKPQPRTIPRPPSPIQVDPNEKVKPILTTGKDKEDGYKAVWFKEDIDPNASEDVVIIPDRADEEEEDEEDEMKIPKVKFGEADRDSGHGAGEDSEEERVMTSSL